MNPPITQQSGRGARNLGGQYQARKGRGAGGRNSTTRLIASPRQTQPGWLPPRAAGARISRSSVDAAGQAW